MRARLLLLGLAALLGQVALLRELAVAFYGSELVMVLAMGVWLLGTGLGALAGPPARRPARAGGRVLLAAAWLLPLSAVLARDLRRLLGGVPGADLDPVKQAVGLLLVLLPPALALGRAFRDLAAARLRRGGTLAAAYAWESGGSLLAGLLAAVLLSLGAPNLAALLLAALAAAVAADPRLGDPGPGDPPGQRRLGRALAPVATGSLVVLALLRLAPVDTTLTRLSHPDLLASRDTPYGRVTVTGRAGQVAVFWNDALVYESQGLAAETFVQPAALACARPDTVLILGGALEGLLREVLPHRPRRVDVVELDRRQADLLRRLLPPADSAGLTDPRVRLLYGDPRRRLAELGRYDLILMGGPQPDSGQANRTYTREFFRLCRRHLRPGGVLALRLKAAENLWSPLLAQRNAGVLRALRAAFPDVLVLPGATSTVLASVSPLPRDPAVQAARYRSRGLADVTRLVGPAWLAYVLTNDRTAALDSLAHHSRAPVNTDRRPVCFQTSLLLWLSRFHPPLAMRRWPATAAAGAAAGLLLAAAWLTAWLVPRRRRRTAGGGAGAATAMLAAGGGLMVLESAVVLLYQTTRGILYRDLGLLLAAVMTGLTAGAAWADRHARDAARNAALNSVPGLRRPVLLLAATALVAAVAARWGGIGLPAALALLAAAGFAVGDLFGRLGERVRRAGGDPSASLYGADLLGGSLGAVLGGLLLIPGLGLDLAAAWTALLVLPWARRRG